MTQKRFENTMFWFWWEYGIFNVCVFVSSDRGIHIWKPGDSLDCSDMSDGEWSHGFLPFTNLSSKSSTLQALYIKIWML